MRVVVVVVLVAACSSGRSNAELGTCKPPPDAGIEQDPQPIHDGDFAWDTDALRAKRVGCKFTRDALPDATLGDYPKTFQQKIKHVIVILRENRSFDHYFGRLRPQHVPLDPDEANPDPKPDDAGIREQPVALHPAKAYCTDPGPDHEWTASRLQFDNGKLDGFVAASGPDAMLQYGADDIGFYYYLARNFALSESYHASLLGPTLANISYYYNATSCGTTENIESTANGVINRFFTRTCPAGRSIFDVLAANGVSARVYNDGPSLADYDPPLPDSGAVALTSYPLSDLLTIHDFRGDVANDRLPEVVFVEPNYGHTHIGTQNDEHPPSNIQQGQHFVWDIVTTLMKYPAVFDESLVFISWDENGGFYDHVMPPPACPPDDQVPCDFAFDRYGFRVPLLAVSPYARPGFASHYTADHTSILRFIEAWKNLPALTNRDANAWPLLDMFDFESPPRQVALYPEPPVASCRPTSAL